MEYDFRFDLSVRAVTTLSVKINGKGVPRFADQSWGHNSMLKCTKEHLCTPEHRASGYIFAGSGVFIGPADLSISLGEPCAGLNGPKTKAAVATIARATKVLS